MDLNKFRDVDLVIDKANANFMQRQFVSQGDLKGRTLTVQITDRGVIGEVPGLTLNLRWHNVESGLTDLSAFECIDQENSLFRIEYPTNMLTPGKVQANIQIIDGEKVTHLKTFELTVQKLAGEMTGIVGKAEYGALVAVLADANQFRTDIDALEIKKAGKIDLAQTNENIENLESTKADKTALAETDAEVAELESSKADKIALDNTNQQVSGLASNKVDKGGNEQVTLGMLSQEVKTAMTGGSVAVVGAGAVNTTNIVNGAVNDKKVTGSLLKALVIPHIIPPNYDTTTKTLTFNGTTGSQDVITWGNSNYTTNTYSIPVGTQVLNETALGTISFKLIFDIVSKVLSIQSWAYELKQNETVLAGFRNSAGKTIISAEFPITVDGIPYSNHEDKQPQASISVLDPYQKPFWVDYENKKIEFLKTIELSCAGENILSAFTIGEKLDVSKLFDPQTTSNWTLLINKKTKTKKFVTYLEMADKENLTPEWWKVSTVRVTGKTLIFDQNLDNYIYNFKIFPTIPGINAILEIKKDTREIIMRSDGSDTIIFAPTGFQSFWQNNSVLGVIPSQTEVPTSALICLYNYRKKILEFFPYNTLYNQMTDDTYMYFGSIRRQTDSAGHLTSFTAANFPFSYIFNSLINSLMPASASSDLEDRADAHVKAINHRGYSAKYPENTLIAFRASKKYGYNIVETDVKFTSDNVPVLLHDDTINRTARNVDGTVIAETIDISSITYEQALIYDFGIWKSTKFAGEKIPTLAEWLKLCKLLDLIPYFEVKSNYTDAQILILKDVIDESGIAEKIVFLGFMPETTKKLSDLYPENTVGVSIGDWTSTAYTQLANLKKDTNNVFLLMQYDFVSNLPDDFFDYDYELYFWNCEGEEKVKNCAEIGATGVFVDGIKVMKTFVGDV